MVPSSFGFGLNAPDCSHLLYKGSSTSVCSSVTIAVLFSRRHPIPAAAVSTLLLLVLPRRSAQNTSTTRRANRRATQPLAVFSRCKCDDDKAPHRCVKTRALAHHRRIRTSSPLLHHLDDDDEEEARIFRSTKYPTARRHAKLSSLRDMKCDNKFMRFFCMRFCRCSPLALSLQIKIS